MLKEQHNNISNDPLRLAEKIKIWANELEFDLVGITNTDLSNYHEPFLNGLKNKPHRTLNFLHEHLEKRLYPEKLVPGTRSIICVGMNYFTPSKHGLIAKYATGKDYHRLIRKRLQSLADKIKQERPALSYRAFCDSAPVLEKPLAEKAGLGWIGKNSLIINKNIGSYLFLGELFINIDLPIDKPAKNLCGNCKRCIQNCPNHAIQKDKTITPERCISYLTIEERNPINTPLGDHIYGCDECQEICPWNQHAQQTRVKALKTPNYFADNPLEVLKSMTESTFSEKAQGTVFKRLGYPKWTDNLKALDCEKKW